MTFAECDFLDGSGPTIALEDLDVFDCLRGDLRDEVVGIEDEGLEQSGGGNVRGELGLVSENTHDGLKEVWKKRRPART